MVLEQERSEIFFDLPSQYKPLAIFCKRGFRVFTPEELLQTVRTPLQPRLNMKWVMLKRLVEQRF